MFTSKAPYSAMYIWNKSPFSFGTTKWHDVHHYFISPVGLQTDWILHIFYLWWYIEPPPSSPSCITTMWSWRDCKWLCGVPFVLSKKEIKLCGISEQCYENRIWFQCPNLYQKIYKQEYTIHNRQFKYINLLLKLSFRYANPKNSLNYKHPIWIEIQSPFRQAEINMDYTFIVGSVPSAT